MNRRTCPNCKSLTDLLEEIIRWLNSTEAANPVWVVRLERTLGEIRSRVAAAAKDCPYCGSGPCRSSSFTNSGRDVARFHEIHGYTL